MVETFIKTRGEVCIEAQIKTFVMERVIALLWIDGEAKWEHICLYNASEFEAIIVLYYEEENTIKQDNDRWY